MSPYVAFAAPGAPVKGLPGTEGCDHPAAPSWVLRDTTAPCLSFQLKPNERWWKDLWILNHDNNGDSPFQGGSTKTIKNQLSSAFDMCDIHDKKLYDEGFPPSPSQFCSWLKTIAEIAFSLFSIYFVLWWLQNPAQREIQVVRYQTDESQVPHVDTSTLLAQRCTKHISLALFLYCPYLRNITSTSLELQIQLVKSCKGIVVKINLRHFLAISHWLTMRRCHNVALLERFWWPHMLPKSGL